MLQSSVSVIDAHGNITSIAYGMDTKTFIEISEAFAKLAVTYQNDIKHVSPSSVTTHLAQIEKDVSHFLSTIKVYMRSPNVYIKYNYYTTEHNCIYLCI